MGGGDDLTISFLGGADEIGASCALVRAGETSVLVDCGIRFEAGRALPDLAAVGDAGLDAILVTHAHTDHTGGLPVVHEAFPAVPVYMTPPTVDLVRILFRDALRLMGEGWEREGEVPLYGEAAVESLLHVARGAPWAEPFAVGEFEVTFLPASHILGAAMVHVATPAGNVLFTGDYSVEAQRTVPALDRPPLPVDLVVAESTYGDRLHSDRQAAERRLVAQVDEVLEAGGRVLIPAFAIGRAQEVLLILRQALEEGGLPGVPIHVDGMVRAVCEAYRAHPRYVASALAKRIRVGHPFYDDRIRPVAAPADREAILAGGPSVIVASSGMLAGGPSAFYAEAMAPRERDAVLLTGYQDEESPGRALLKLAAGEGPRTLRLGERQVPVACSFGTYGLSAHADRMQMAGFLAGLRAQTVVLVHGDQGAKRSLARSLPGSDVVLAANGDTVVRRYGARRRGPAASPLLEIDAAQARQLLAGAPEGFLRVDRVVRDLLGRRPAPLLAERLVRRLEDLGVAIRDDDRRGFLRILDPSPAEDPVAEELKAGNPKGRLLEYLARRNVEPPAFDPQVVPGGRRRIELRLELDGREYSTGAVEAATPRLAEQLAARTLLDRIAADEPGGDLIEIGEEEADRLRADNPKGRLNVQAMTLRLPPVEFRLTARTDGGFVGRAVLAFRDGRVLQSADWRAAAAKTVEQAAALDLLGRIEGFERPAPAPESSDEDPRFLLNRFRQTGRIANYGYDLVETLGPAHRPTFRVAGWVDLRPGDRRTAEPADGASRKEGELLAAHRIVALLRDPGRPVSE